MRRFLFISGILFLLSCAKKESNTLFIYLTNLSPVDKNVEIQLLLDDSVAFESNVPFNGISTYSISENLELQKKNYTIVAKISSHTLTDTINVNMAEGNKYLNVTYNYDSVMKSEKLLEYERDLHYLQNLDSLFLPDSLSIKPRYLSLFIMSESPSHQ